MNGSFDAVTGKTRICGLIGHPVRHTLSPLIHNTLAAKCSRDMVYVPFDVAPGSVAKAVTGAYELNMLGLNVTVPHKIEVMESLREIDPQAAAIGAVNTLVRTDGGFKGYNTDFIGLKRALEADGIRLGGRNAVILGAGGAARSAAFLCAFEQAAGVYILNRNYDRAVSLCDSVNAYCEKETGFAKLCKPLRLDQYDTISENGLIVIQASSVGLYPGVDDVIIPDCGFYDRIAYGYDVVYKPSETAFMKLVRSHGADTANGLKMLLYQGIAAFELWNNVSVDEQIAGEVLTLLEEASMPSEET